ncbi:hypothetical protein [Pilibacter termitis]|uniref:hypothetical protein n=1 Tax=Pilibacter termitis TaxID=263852 RepID=UPI001186C273|nr:hypothetical protein [Pilibacter termitis]
MKSVAVNRAVYILETKFRAALRTVAKLLHFVARQRKAEKCVKEFATVSRVVYLLVHFVSHTVFLRIKDS